VPGLRSLSSQKAPVLTDRALSALNLVCEINVVLHSCGLYFVKVATQVLISRQVISSAVAILFFNANIFRHTNDRRSFTSLKFDISCGLVLNANILMQKWEKTGVRVSMVRVRMKVRLSCRYLMDLLISHTFFTFV